jgi:hypothetical protein
VHAFIHLAEGHGKLGTGQLPPQTVWALCRRNEREQRNNVVSSPKIRLTG